MLNSDTTTIEAKREVRQKLRGPLDEAKFMTV